MQYNKRYYLISAEDGADRLMRKVSSGPLNEQRKNLTVDPHERSEFWVEGLPDACSSARVQAKDLLKVETCCYFPDGILEHEGLFLSQVGKIKTLIVITIIMLVFRITNMIMTLMKAAIKIKI